LILKTNSWLNNSILIIFLYEIIFERSKLAKLQSKTYEDLQDFDACQSSCSISIPDTEELRSHVSGYMNTSGASNESCTSSVTTSDSSNQSPGYLSANTPRKQKLAVQIKSGKQEIKNLKKNIVSLSQQYYLIMTQLNIFLRLSEKYLTPGLFTIVKFQINLKEKQKGYRYNNEIKQLALTIYFLGPRVYKLLLNILSLPSISTLKRPNS